MIVRKPQQVLHGTCVTVRWTPWRFIGRLPRRNSVSSVLWCNSGTLDLPFLFLRRLLVSRAHLQADRHLVEGQEGAHLVFKVSDVVGCEGVGVVDEDDESGWPDALLRGVKDTGGPRTATRRRP